MIKNRRYLYFWHYETRGSRSVRREDYVGPVGSEEARIAVLRRLEEYHRRVENRMRSRADVYRRALQRFGV